MKIYWIIFLIIEHRTRLKRFQNFENISYKENDFIKIGYVFVYKSFIKTFNKRSRIESIEDVKKIIKESS